MATTWADIQQLAADLQRAQLAEGFKRLSEANCVEVVSSLVGSGTVDLVVSTDGKEYVTRAHLLTEVRNECSASGGRVALTDLSGRLRVELTHVEAAVAAIIRQGREFIVCVGELVTRSYIDELCERMNVRLKEVGQISALQLTRSWDLPTELLNGYVLPELGRKVHAIRFDDFFYTTVFIGALKRRCLAILAALTKPIPLSPIHAHLGVSETLFLNVWSELNDQITAYGQAIGAKGSLKAVFVPRVHTELVKAFVKRAIQDNGFVDCLVLKKMSIPDQTAFFKGLFLDPDEYASLIFVPNVVVMRRQMWTEVENTINDQMDAEHYSSVEECLPGSLLSFLSPPDLHTLIAELVQKHPTKASGSGGGKKRPTAATAAAGGWRLSEDRTTIYEEAPLVDATLKRLEPYICECAKHDAPTFFASATAAVATAKKGGGRASVAKSGKTGIGGGKTTADDDDDWTIGGSAGGKAGKKKGGKRGGAPTKTTATHQPPSPDESADNAPPSESLATACISMAQIFVELDRFIKDNEPCGEHLTAPLMKLLNGELAEELRDAVNALYRRELTHHVNAAELAHVKAVRRAADAYRARCHQLYVEICAFEEGAIAFDESLADDLRAHLQKTLCTELATRLLTLITTDGGLADDNADRISTAISTKARNEAITSIGDTNAREAVQAIFNALQPGAGSLATFHEAIAGLRAADTLLGGALHPPEEREKGDFLTVYSSTLRSQLADTVGDDRSSIADSAPLFLLTYVLHLYATHHRLAVHASGKFVGQLTAQLVDRQKPSSGEEKSDQTSTEQIPSDVLDRLVGTQKLVVEWIRSSSDNNRRTEELKQILEENIAALWKYADSTARLTEKVPKKAP